MSSQKTNSVMVIPMKSIVQIALWWDDSRGRWQITYRMKNTDDFYHLYVYTRDNFNWANKLFSTIQYWISK